MSAPDQFLRGKCSGCMVVENHVRKATVEPVDAEPDHRHLFRQFPNPAESFVTVAEIVLDQNSIKFGKMPE